MNDDDTGPTRILPVDSEQTTGLDPNRSTVPHNSLATGDYTPHAEPAAPRVRAADDLPAIPGYVVLGEIARGGMGKVLAARDLALDREVAVKVLLPRADPSRFVVESKITAKLPHPGIPPVYALGTLDDGSPFLAMKLIRGRTLADVLLSRPHPAADLPRYVQIFEQISQAVGFAHTQSVLHRDLKPANVMVGAFGEVQVMDWGLARTVGSESEDVWSAECGMRNEDEVLGSDSALRTPHSALTQAGTILGTPAYMAPEQARGEVVDARADVFALGGILCCVLIGRPAFEGTSSVDVLKMAATGRVSDAHALLDRCGADPELIALAKSCLSPDAADRPADGQAVADLVAGYRAGVAERLRRAETERAAAAAKEAERAKRRKLLLAAAGTIAAVLLVGIVGTTIGLVRTVWARQDAEAAQLAERRAKDEALEEKANAVRAADAEAKANREARVRLAQAEKSNAVLGSIFVDADIRRAKEEGKPLERVLADRFLKAAADLDGSSVGDPLVVAELQNRLGVALSSLGVHREAIPIYEKSLATRRQLLGPNDRLTLQSRSNLAEQFRAVGDSAQAVREGEEVCKLAATHLGPNDALTLEFHNNLGQSYRAAGKLQLAEQALDDALAAMKVVLGPRDLVTAKCMGNLAHVCLDLGKTERAAELFEEGLEVHAEALGAEHFETLTLRNNLAAAYDALGQTERAIPLYEASLKDFTARFGADHPHTVTCTGNLAAAYQTVGKYDQAMPMMEAVHRYTVAKFGLDHPATIKSRNNLSVVYSKLNKPELALPLTEETLKVSIAKNGPDHPITLTLMSNLGQAYRTAKKFDRAVPLMEEALKRRTDKLGADHPSTLVTLNNLASAYHECKRLDRAIPLFEHGYQRMVAAQGAEHPNTVILMANYGSALLEANEGARGVAVLNEYVRLSRPKKPGTEANFASLLATVAARMATAKEYAAAEPHFRECVQLRTKHAPDVWLTFNAQSQLGGALLGQKKYAEAEPLLRAGYAGMVEREAKIPRASKNRLPEAADRLVDLYAATNKPDELTKWQAERATYDPEPAPAPRAK